MYIYIYIHTHTSIQPIVCKQPHDDHGLPQEPPQKITLFYDTAQSRSSHGDVSYEDNGDNKALSAVLLF